jgi:hypothetical protein
MASFGLLKIAHFNLKAWIIQVTPLFSTRGEGAHGECLKKKG